MQFPWRCACLACRNHLVGVYILAHRILRKLRRRPQMFGRRQTVTVVIDVQLDAVAVGILIINGGLSTGISTQYRPNVLLFQSRIRAEQVVESSVLKGEVLEPLLKPERISHALRSLGIRSVIAIEGQAEVFEKLGPVRHNTGTNSIED